MIAEFVEKFDAGRETLKAGFARAHPGSYWAIVKAVLGVIGGEGYDEPDPSTLVEIRSGDYQGNLLYVVSDNSGRFWSIKVYYGSCSGCDTLAAIRDYSIEEVPTDEQVRQYMELALHVVQWMKVV